MTGRLLLSVALAALALSAAALPVHLAHKQPAPRERARVSAQPLGRPVVGVLTMPITAPLHQNKTAYSYFVKTIPDWIMQGGADVIPIPYNMDFENMRKLLMQVNAIFFTGGHLVINSTDPSEYVESADFLFHNLRNLNNNNDYMELWGTCQGFEMISVLEAGDSILSATDAENLFIPLNFTAAAPTSKLYGGVPAEVYNTLASQPVTTNEHAWGVLTKAFAESSALSSDFTVLSTNTDRAGQEFVSSMEHKTLPFFGIQWHPEIPPWSVNSSIPYSPAGADALSFMAQRLVQNIGSNSHFFANAVEEKALLVSNFPTASMYGFEVYVFPEDV